MMGLIGGSLPDPNMSQVPYSCPVCCISCIATVALSSSRAAWSLPLSHSLLHWHQVEALASSAVRAADKLHAALLIVFTSSGRTARIIAK
jgi:pyruvate kinase